MKLPVKSPSNSHSCDSMTKVNSKEEATVHFVGKGLFLDTDELNC